MAGFISAQAFAADTKSRLALGGGIHAYYTSEDALGSLAANAQPSLDNEITDITSDSPQLRLGLSYQPTDTSPAISVFGAAETTASARLSNAAETGSDHLSMGLALEYAGITLGAGVDLDTILALQSADEQRNWHVAAEYVAEQSAWRIGVQFDQNIDRLSGVETTTEGWEFGGSYTVGPGIDLTTGIQFWEGDSRDSDDREPETMMFIGTAISF